MNGDSLSESTYIYAASADLDALYCVLCVIERYNHTRTGFYVKSNNFCITYPSG